MGDEFALLDLASGQIFPFPRLVSLKNGAIDVLSAEVPPDRMGPLLANTAKGDIRHLVPRGGAIDRMEEGGQPALLLFPRFGHAADRRDVGQAEVFMRLTQASTNYVALGEAGFLALSRLVQRVPAHAIDFPSGDDAITMIERLWEERA